MVDRERASLLPPSLFGCDDTCSITANTASAYISLVASAIHWKERGRGEEEKEREGGKIDREREREVGEKGR